MNKAIAAVAAAWVGTGDGRALNRLTLQFTDPGTEANYRTQRIAGDVRYARAVLILIFVVTLAIVPLDLLLFPQVRWPLLLFGHGLEISLLVGLFALSFVAFFRVRYMTLMTVLALAFSTIYAVWDVFFSAPDIYVAGGSIVVIAIYVLLPFEFLHGLATGLACSVLYLLIIGLAHPMRGLPYSTLVTFTVFANVIGAASLYHLERLRRLDFANLREIEAQRERYRDLLTRILPRSIADRLQRGEAHIADRSEETTVLFADVVGFTPAAAQHAPEEVLAFLDRIFAAFDILVEKHGVEKIKTIGDAYMVASGVPASRSDHADAVADLALDMLAAVRGIAPLEGDGLQVRIGIASGPVMAGIIGDKRFGYDLWGDTVNMASRMEAFGTPGRIQVSEETYRRLAEDFLFEPRGDVEIKGLGAVVTWFLVGRKPGLRPS